MTVISQLSGTLRPADPRGIQPKWLNEVYAKDRELAISLGQELPNYLANYLFGVQRARVRMRGSGSMMAQ